MKNCILLGINAGVDLPEDSEGVTIIGDNIGSLDQKTSDSLIIGDKCIIGKYIFGKECNLKDIIRNHVKENYPGYYDENVNWVMDVPVID